MEFLELNFQKVWNKKYSEMVWSGVNFKKFKLLEMKNFYTQNQGSNSETAQ